MITWLQNFFLKHNKWLFGGLLIVIIVTFVLTIGPQSFFGSGGQRQREALQYYGYDLSSPADQRAMAYTAEISAILHPELGVRRQQIMDYAYLRVAALGIASQLGIPAPQKEAIREYVETLQIFQNPGTGEFSAETYQRMLDALTSGGRYEREAIARVLREDYRISQVRDALGGPAYSLPYENRTDFVDRQTSYTVELARFNFEDFNPEIDSSGEELRQFYNENPARYEIPETISVSALMFKADAYLDEVPEPGEEALQAHFNANRARFQPDRESETAESGELEQPEVTLDDVREQVISDWKMEQAAEIAARKSEQFSVRLWQEAVQLGSETYQSLIGEFSVEVADVPAYSRGQTPEVQGISAELLDSMWIYANNPNRYFSDIGRMPDGAVVLVAHGVTGARLPGFEEVRDQVAADFRQSEKRRLFAEKGAELRRDMMDRLREGASFAEVASTLDLESESLDSFEGSNVPQQLRRSQLWEQVRFLDQGRVSEMILEGDQGTFVYMAEKDIPEVDTESEEFKEFLAQRETALNQAMGWARLREITDQSLESILGTTEIP